MAAGTATGSRKRKGRGGGDKQSSVCEISAQLLEAAVRGDVPITSVMFEIETKGKDRGDTRKRLHMTSRGQIVAAVRKCRILQLQIWGNCCLQIYQKIPF